MQGGEGRKIIDAIRNATGVKILKADPIQVNLLPRQGKLIAVINPVSDECGLDDVILLSGSPFAQPAFSPSVVCYVEEVFAL